MHICHERERFRRSPHYSYSIIVNLKPHALIAFDKFRQFFIPLATFANITALYVAYFVCFDASEMRFDKP